MSTTNKNVQKRSFVGIGLVSFAGLILLLLTVATYTPRTLISSSFSQFTLGNPATASPSAEKFYLLLRRNDNSNSVLELNSRSGHVERSFEVGYNSLVKLESEKQIIYVFNEPLNEIEQGRGVVSAIDIRTGAVFWKTHLALFPFSESPVNGAWLSADEELLYLEASSDGFQPHIITLDTQTGALINDLEIPLPYPPNEDAAFPQIWKLPWAETLIVVSRDQLFMFDLNSGEVSNEITLFDARSMDRVPKDLPLGLFVQDGVLDQEKRQLFLASSPQEVISVDLTVQPFQVETVLSIPPGWQFGGSAILFFEHKERDLYVQVKSEDTFILNGMESDEIWIYSSDDWKNQFQWSLREHMPALVESISDRNIHIGLDLTSYGLAASDDGRVYLLTPHGLIPVIRGLTNSQLRADSIVMKDADFSSALRYFVVP